MMLGHTALPFYVFHRLDGDERTSGTIAAFLSLGYMIVCLSTSGVVRRSANSLKVAAFGALGFGVLFGGAGLTDNRYLFAILVTAGFCSMAMSWPAMHAWLGGEPDLARRGRLMAAFNIAWSVGMALGAISAGPAYDVYFRLPFFALALLALIAFVLLYAQPHERDYFDPAPESDAATGANSNKSEAFLTATWLAIFIGFAIQGASRSVFPKRLETMVDDGSLYLVWDSIAVGDPATFGAASLFSVLVFAITITSAAVYVVMGRTTRWHHRFGLIIALQVCAAAACWVMSVSHSMLVLYVCYTVIGANTYVVFFTGIFYAVANSDRKHRRAAINESLVGGGAFAGSLTFGWAAGLTSIATVFAWAPAIFACAIALELLLLRRVFAH